MIITRGFAAAIFAAAAVGAASPAAAQDPMSGVYTYNQAGQPSQTWSIYPTCVPAGCTLHVSMPDPAGGSGGGDARLVNDQWNFGAHSSVGMTCPDGSKGEATLNYIWDDATLTGTKKTIHGETCGMEPGMTSDPFTLTYVKPLGNSVELYPLQCPTWPNCSWNSVIPGTAAGS